MTNLQKALADYLSLRRSLGYKLERTEKLLRQFLNYLEFLGADHVTTQTALSWACLPEHGGDNWLAGRLTVVRGFAKYLHSLDSMTEVPPTGLLRERSHRTTPYLYSDEDIVALMKMADNISAPFRAATYSTLIGLVAVTGMRIGEAISLDKSDLELDKGLITIRFTKFGKTRELPLHPTTLQALTSYLELRDQIKPTPATSALFVSLSGARLRYCNVQLTFQDLISQVGIASKSSASRPRIHDLRHSFAVNTLIDTYRDGTDPKSRIALLSTYLGHADPVSTYWYLSAAPELLSLAAQRLEEYRGGTL